jgi:hypothetical protein
MYFEVQSDSHGCGHKLITADLENNFRSTHLERYGDDWVTEFVESLCRYMMITQHPHFLWMERLLMNVVGICSSPHVFCELMYPNK